MKVVSFVLFCIFFIKLNAEECEVHTHTRFDAAIGISPYYLPYEKNKLCTACYTSGTEIGYCETCTSLENIGTGTFEIYEFYAGPGRVYSIGNEQYGSVNENVIEISVLFDAYSLSGDGYYAFNLKKGGAFSETELAYSVDPSTLGTHETTDDGVKVWSGLSCNGILGCASISFFYGKKNCRIISKFNIILSTRREVEEEITWEIIIKDASNNEIMSTGMSGTCPLNCKQCYSDDVCNVCQTGFFRSTDSKCCSNVLEHCKICTVDAVTPVCNSCETGPWYINSGYCTQCVLDTSDSDNSDYSAEDTFFRLGESDHICTSCGAGDTCDQCKLLEYGDNIEVYEIYAGFKRDSIIAERYEMTVFDYALVEFTTVMDLYYKDVDLNMDIKIYQCGMLIYDNGRTLKFDDGFSGTTFNFEKGSGCRIRMGHFQDTYLITDSSHPCFSKSVDYEKYGKKTTKYIYEYQIVVEGEKLSETNLYIPFYQTFEKQFEFEVVTEQDDVVVMLEISPYDWIDWTLQNKRTVVDCGSACDNEDDTTYTFMFDIWILADKSIYSSVNLIEMTSPENLASTSWSMSPIGPTNFVTEAGDVYIQVFHFETQEVNCHGFIPTDFHFEFLLDSETIRPVFYMGMEDVCKRVEEFGVKIDAEVHYEGKVAADFTTVDLNDETFLNIDFDLEILPSKDSITFTNGYHLGFGVGTEITSAKIETCDGEVFEKNGLTIETTSTSDWIGEVSISLQFAGIEATTPPDWYLGDNVNLLKSIYSCGVFDIVVTFNIEYEELQLPPRRSLEQSETHRISLKVAETSSLFSTGAMVSVWVGISIGFIVLVVLAGIGAAIVVIKQRRQKPSA